MDILNIALVEDNEVDYANIFRKLTGSALKDKVRILPDIKNQKNAALNNHAYFIKKIREIHENDYNEFFTFFDQYKIGLFVIDICLHDNGDDENGLAFARAICSWHMEKYKKWPRLILISIHNRDYEPAGLPPEKYIKFIPKDSNQFYLGSIYNEVLRYAKKSNVQKSAGQDDDIPDISLTSDITEHGFRFAFYSRIKKFFKGIDEQIIKKIIDIFIIIIFYSAIIFTATYAFNSLVNEFAPQKVKALLSYVFGDFGNNLGYSAANDPMERLQSQADIQSISHKEPDADIKLLTHAEHIFLYLLPLVIVFGFYLYYMHNLRKGFQVSKVHLTEEDHRKSTHSMNYTKTVFISSIISFTIIKLLIVIFSEAPNFRLQVGAALVLIAVLMTYYILINRSKGSGH